MLKSPLAISLAPGFLGLPGVNHLQLLAAHRNEPLRLVGKVENVVDHLVDLPVRIEFSLQPLHDLDLGGIDPLSIGVVPLHLDPEADVGELPDDTPLEVVDIARKGGNGLELGEDLLDPQNLGVMDIDHSRSPIHKEGDCSPLLWGSNHPLLYQAGVRASALVDPAFGDTLGPLEVTEFADDLFGDLADDLHRLDQVLHLLLQLRHRIGDVLRTDIAVVHSLLDAPV